MAYADKCTTMRRCAVIGKQSNGMILWEGVNIEGRIILRNVSNGSIKVLRCFDEFNEPDYWNGYLLIYQDNVADSFWCPRDDDCDFDNDKEEWVLKSDKEN